jgi:hypothetical protein
MAEKECCCISHFLDARGRLPGCRLSERRNGSRSFPRLHEGGYHRKVLDQKGCPNLDLHVPIGVVPLKGMPVGVVGWKFHLTMDAIHVHSIVGKNDRDAHVSLKS